MSKPIKPVIFGEVLYDCFPDGRQVLGGAPFNVAWNLQALGLDPLFISRVGEDELGDQIRQAMQNWGMSLDGVQVDHEHPTGTVEVQFKHGEPQYEIVNNRAWDYIEPNNTNWANEASILYHGSLALRNTVSRNTLESFKQNVQCALFVDVNLRSPWWERDAVHNIITNSQVVKINEEELSLIVTAKKSVEDQIAYLLERSEIETLILTQGSKGALAALKNGEKIHVEPNSVTEVVDTVGAGDAFSSVMLMGIIHEWPMELALQRAQQFASEIVGIRGATTTDNSFYQKFKEDWN